MSKGVTYKLVLWYNGKQYVGFQIQNEAPTIQSVLNKALAHLFGVAIKTMSAGRTDTGVHAFGQVVHFKAEGIPVENLKRALNHRLPEDIRVREAEIELDTFHSIYSAKSREYRYLWTHEDVPLWTGDFVVKVPFETSLANLEQVVSDVKGVYDCVHFRSAGSTDSGTKRDIKKIAISSQVLTHLYNKEADGILVNQLTIEANGFLYRMVRNIMGALFEICKGRQSDRSFIEMLEAKTSYRYTPAPAKGLCLFKVNY
ncbi:MAG: tRNA pseudouridine(38-40) synthase TruA [Flavobacteriales bacterium]|nr:tRNA pseudouridine(38-40) synthase TruA [Flavobacteriales bacterium]